MLGKRENPVPFVKPVVDYHKVTEKEFNDYTNEIMQIFILNDTRKRAKTDYETAKLAYENAKSALKKKQATILRIFKEINSDESQNEEKR